MDDAHPTHLDCDIILCCDCEGTPAELDRMFRAIERAAVPANFFFVGETVLEQTALVREIASLHQAESHTLRHWNLRRLDKERQRRQIMDGKAVVEDAIGRPTRGFRAPFHAINLATVEILVEEGFTYDASGLYYRYDFGPVIELTPAWFREWMPLYGALRLDPNRTFGIFRWLCRRAARRGGRVPVVLPAHPQYSGLDDRLAAGFEGFLRWARDGGARFWPIDAWLEHRHGVAHPAWRAPRDPRAMGAGRG